MSLGNRGSAWTDLEEVLPRRRAPQTPEKRLDFKIRFRFLRVLIKIAIFKIILNFRDNFAFKLERLRDGFGWCSGDKALERFDLIETPVDTSKPRQIFVKIHKGEFFEFPKPI